MVLVLTAIATLALDLVQAVIVGLAVAVAGALALRAVARNVRLDEMPLAHDLPGDHTEDEHALLAEHIVAYRLDGPLFFAAAHRFLLELSEVADVSGIRDGHHQPLHALGVIAHLDQAGRVFATTPEAIAAARDQLQHAGLLPRRRPVLPR
ncbi:hypothetical protein ACWDRB_60665 [Nonomuraea sp. NPDC003707]